MRVDRKECWATHVSLSVSWPASVSKLQRLSPCRRVAAGGREKARFHTQQRTGRQGQQGPNSPPPALPAAYSTVQQGNYIFLLLQPQPSELSALAVDQFPKSEITLQSERRIASLCFGFAVCVQHSMAHACCRAVVPTTGKASPCWSKGDGWYPRGNFWATENMKEDTFCRLLI